MWGEVEVERRKGDWVGCNGARRSEVYSSHHLLFHCPACADSSRLYRADGTVETIHILQHLASNYRLLLNLSQNHLLFSVILSPVVFTTNCHFRLPRNIIACGKIMYYKTPVYVVCFYCIILLANHKNIIVPI